jgi:hypothetical protein
MPALICVSSKKSSDMRAHPGCPRGSNRAGRRAIVSTRSLIVQEKKKTFVQRWISACPAALGRHHARSGSTIPNILQNRHFRDRLGWPDSAVFGPGGVEGNLFVANFFRPVKPGKMFRKNLFHGQRRRQVAGPT